MKRKGFAQCKRILAGTVAAFMLTGVCPFNVLAMPAAEPSGYVMPAPAQGQSYDFASGYSSTQGPVWFYRWMDKDTGALSDMTWSSGNSRWEGNDHGGHWMRIFNDGLMSGNDGCSAVIEWVAPQDGVVLVTADALDGKTAAGEIAMESERTDRDGATLRVEHNGVTIWGGCSTQNNRKHLAFDPIRVAVKAGDTLRFVENGDGGNAEYNNDRVFWNPTVTYEADASGVMLSGAQMVSGGSVQMQAANLPGIAPEDVALYASVNGAARTEREATGASLENGTLTIDFEPIREESAAVQLFAVVGGTSAMVSYNTADYPSQLVEVTASVRGRAAASRPPA